MEENDENVDEDADSEIGFSGVGRLLNMTFVHASVMAMIVYSGTISLSILVSSSLLGFESKYWTINFQCSS